MVATNGDGKRALMWNNSSDRGKPKIKKDRQNIVYLNTSNEMFPTR